MFTFDAAKWHNMYPENPLLKEVPCALRPVAAPQFMPIEFVFNTVKKIVDPTRWNNLETARIEIINKLSTIRDGHWHNYVTNALLKLFEELNGGEIPVYTEENRTKFYNFEMSILIIFDIYSF